MTRDVIIHSSMTSPHRLGLLLRTKRGWSLGRAWLVVIPLLTFVLCQLCHLQLMPRRQSTPSLDLVLTRLYLQVANVSAEADKPAASSVSRLYDWERTVSEGYLHVQLGLAVSSGRLLPVQRSPPLADVGTLRDLRTFQPLLTPREKGHLLYLFQLFTQACRHHRLPFFLLGNSLLGSLRHHGVIPWKDVSITVGMNGEQQGVVREVLEGVEGVTLMWPNPYSWSLRLRDTRPDPPSLSRMTFIIIQFFQQNSSHVWADTWGSRRLFTADRHRVFPLALRPFEGGLTPVPCDVMSVLTSADVRQCRVVAEDLEELEFRDAGVLPCDVLARVFPFVTRRLAMTSHSTLEQVTVNGSLLSTVLVDTACQSAAAAHSPPRAAQHTAVTDHWPPT